MMEQVPNLMRLARAEAIAFGHEFVATEHLLLAISALSDCPAARALASFGLTRPALVSVVRSLAKPGLSEVHRDRLPLNPFAIRAIERAVNESRRLGHDRVEPEHVLLALLADNQSVAVVALAQLGADPGLVRLAALAEAGWD